MGGGFGPTSSGDGPWQEPGQFIPVGTEEVQMPREDRAFRKIACFHHEAHGQLTGQSVFGKQRRWAVVLHGAANRTEKVAVGSGSGSVRQRPVVEACTRLCRRLLFGPQHFICRHLGLTRAGSQ